MTSRNQKRWQDLSTPQKMSVVLFGTVQIILLAAALLDIRKRSADELTGGNKRIWTMLVFINYIGPIAYFLFGRKRTAVAGDQIADAN